MIDDWWLMIVDDDDDEEEEEEQEQEEEEEEEEDEDEGEGEGEGDDDIGLSIYDLSYLWSDWSDCIYVIGEDSWNPQKIEWVWMI